MRDFLRKVRQFFFAQKYRFDLGLQFMVFVNFVLLVITASDKLKQWLGIERISELVLLFIPAAFVGTLLFGYFLDKIVKMQTQTEEQYGQRSPLWRKTFEELAAIRSDLRELKRNAPRRGK